MGPGSSFRISERRYAIVLGSYSLPVAAVVGLLPFLTPVDAQGRIICVGLAAFFGLIAAWRFFRAFRSSPSEPAFQDLESAPPEAQEGYYRRMLWITAIAFPALTAITAWQLSRLESGAAKRVRLPGALTLLYNLGGFGAALVSIPILGLACVCVFIYKLKQLERRRPPK